MKPSAVMLSVLLSILPVAIAAEPAQPEKHEHEHEHSGHSDIEASYQFSCKTATAPVTVKVHLFSLFPELQKINSSWITDRGQSAATLSPKDPQLSLN